MKAADSQWESLGMYERMHEIEATLHGITSDGRAPTAAEWNAKRPAWMPTETAIHLSFSARLLTIAMCLGFTPSAKQLRSSSEVESKCACGLPLTQYRLATIGTVADDIFSAVLMPLCDRCAALWDEVEN